MNVIYIYPQILVLKLRQSQRKFSWLLSVNRVTKMPESHQL